MNALREALSDYIAVRRALGSKLQGPAAELSHFLDFLEKDGATFITTELALCWAQQPVGVRRAYWSQRLTAVRGFATWLHAFDPRTEIPPKGILKGYYLRSSPYIFTPEEIDRLMAEIDQRRSPKDLRDLAIRTVLGLLAATGLRPGEAVALDAADVDLHDGILSIRNTKFGKSRLVPVDGSTQIELAAYACQRDQLCRRKPCVAFFIDEGGERLKARTVRWVFGNLTRHVGMRAPAQGHKLGKGPRLMDFRHTFATTRLIEWYRRGTDVSRALPALSTYLGHVSIAHTYWYIEAVPELLLLATEASSVRQQGGVR